MTVRVLGPADQRAVADLLGEDPVLNVFVSSRVIAGVLDRHTPGELWGYPGHPPRSLLHVGANLVPVNAGPGAVRAYAERLGPQRSASAILGLSDQVFALWEALSDLWGDNYAAARAVRERQPVLATDEVAPIPADPRVRQVTMADFDSYFSAAVDMYTEELGEDPLLTNPVGYRRYVASLVEMGRAFGIVENGEVIFKADVGAAGQGVSQVQGVWVDRRLRGRGLAAPAMAAVTNAIIGSGRVAALYVNDFNAPALATYRRCGYTERGVFTTVLY